MTAVPKRSLFDAPFDRIGTKLNDMPRSEVMEMGTTFRSNAEITVKTEGKKHEENCKLDQLVISTGESEYKSLSNEDGGEELSVAVSTESSTATGILSSITTSRRRNALFVGLIALFGTCASMLFLGMGITYTVQEEEQKFRRTADDLLLRLEAAVHDYVVELSIVHEACRSRQNVMTRDEFNEIYQYLISNERVEFQALECAFNVSHDERANMEAEAKAYYADNYPDIEYRGFLSYATNVTEPLNTGTTDEYTLNTTEKTRCFQYGTNRVTSPIKPFYFPSRFVQPVLGNEEDLDLDLYSSPLHLKSLDHILVNRQPIFTERIRNHYSGVERSCNDKVDIDIYSIRLIHPGIPVYRAENRRQVLASMLIPIPSLLKKVLEMRDESITVYIFDSTDKKREPVFLGGAARAQPETAARRNIGVRYEDLFTLSESNSKNVSDMTNGEAYHVYATPETTISFLQSDQKYFREFAIPVASQNSDWTVMVVPITRTAGHSIPIVIFGSAMILAACIVLSLFISGSLRTAQLQVVKSQAAAEKSRLLVDHARSVAKAERDLNDFLAHEVRNPLAAALSAMSFVSTAINTAPPLRDVELVREDLTIMQRSLQFINDLLRSMLDMHRAVNKQMKIVYAPTDLVKDVFEPVACMLYDGSVDVDIIIDCPQNLFVSTDRLRLTQAMLNLSKNASKFVTRGYIRMRAEVFEENVYLSVEDSGPGIPVEKRNMLFSKYQESLDLLNQGTGIGLHLSKSLLHLMNSSIWLDDEYDSGVDGCPGTRFVISLNQPPLNLDSACLDSLERDIVKKTIEHDCDANLSDFRSAENIDQESNGVPELPCDMTVLLIDDNLVLRKLFSRAVQRIAPTWDIQEASSGEAALHLYESKSDICFDIIFIDQYLASTQKQLLGTETVTALRAKGVQSIICGLSANNMEAAFLSAGADFFMTKPLPSSSTALQSALHEFVKRMEERTNEEILDS